MMKNFFAQNLPRLAVVAAAAAFSSCAVQSNPSTPSSSAATTAAQPTALAPTITATPAATPPPAAPAVAKQPDKVTLHFVKADSEETAGEDAKGANAVDGDPNTFWHTQWQDESPPCPHEIIIELVPAASIKGFTYLPRQDEEVNGTINEYEFYVSNDGKDFGAPVKKGTFDGSKNKQTVTFAPVPCHFFKLRALSEINGAAWTSAAEIGVVLEGASN